MRLVYEPADYDPRTPYYFTLCDGTYLVYGGQILDLDEDNAAWALMYPDWKIVETIQ